jgi:hypothetical protein
LKYIDSTLKVDFELDTTSKPKPVAGPDNLLLMHVQHWARDKSVFPTEDDCYDVATVMLFQAYTGSRPAEFVHSSKGKASEDSLGEREETNENSHPQKAVYCDYDDNSDTGDNSDADEEPEYDGDSNTGDGSGSDDDVLFDSEDDGSDDGGADEDDEDMDEHGGSDSSYASNGTDVTMTEDTDKCYTTELDESGEPLQQNSDTAEPGK